MTVSILRDPVEVVEAILTESMIPLNEQAFEKARDEFGRTYASAYREALRSCDHLQAEDEALTEALQAFIAGYLHEAKR